MVKETFQGQAKRASALASGVKKISAAHPKVKKISKMTHYDVHVPAATLLVFRFIWCISFIH